MVLLVRILVDALFGTALSIRLDAITRLARNADLIRLDVSGSCQRSKVVSYGTCDSKILGPLGGSRKVGVAPECILYDISSPDPISLYIISLPFLEYSMPIAALPPDTVHVIGASQVLTDSASLVKEVSISLSHSHCSLGRFTKFEINLSNINCITASWLFSKSSLSNTDSEFQFSWLIMLLMLALPLFLWRFLPML